MTSPSPQPICLRDGAQLILVAARGHTWGEAEQMPRAWIGPELPVRMTSQV